eukprot:CAMPEP_0174349780 /NCGR_PEP_ID=MMETSP0811_2-20130205/6605_1 /TAXON_ID=73025 ORGANISM="Eutreptiella gymnastica-like, Strain CCMP1594" /NCGR_SAMPLE_ID=MMETSP0811_2 /ASSEMBLY_ACC=CAM_ASM_000667 /LENGTH=31 /DNA_ID= /DNA_START= /DNA_END= /DNA_ORIENTATION=
MCSRPIHLMYVPVGMTFANDLAAAESYSQGQ